MHIVAKHVADCST